MKGFDFIKKLRINNEDCQKEKETF